MASSINAITTGSGGVITTADNSGNLNIQSGGTTVVAVTSAGAAVTGTLTVNGTTVTASQWTTTGSDIYYSTGNVGIGNSSMASFPAAMRQLVVGSGSGNQGMTIYAGPTSYSAYLAFKSVADTSTQGLMYYDFSNNSLVTYTNGALATKVDSTGSLEIGNGGASANGTGYCTLKGSSASGEGPRIQGYRDTTRKWQIACESVIVNSNSDSLMCRSGSTGGVLLAASGTSWSAYSDERMKDIIEPIDNAVEKTISLRAVIGKYKDDKEGTRRSFLIAQDVQAVLPEAVIVGDDEQQTLSLAYTEVIPLLVAAIKELKAEIDLLKGVK